MWSLGIFHVILISDSTSFDHNDRLPTIHFVGPLSQFAWKSLNTSTDVLQVGGLALQEPPDPTHLLIKHSFDPRRASVTK